MLRPPLQQHQKLPTTTAASTFPGYTSAGVVPSAIPPVRSIATASQNHAGGLPQQSQQAPRLMMPRLPSRNNITMSASHQPGSSGFTPVVSSLSGSAAAGATHPGLTRTASLAAAATAASREASKQPPPPPPHPGMISQFAPLRTLKPLADAAQRLRSNDHRRKSMASIKSYMTTFSVINRKNLKRFGKSKITYLVINGIFTLIGICFGLFTTFTWINDYETAYLTRTVSESALVAITFTSTLMSFTGFIGFLGAFTHRKSFLTMYNILVWPILAGWIASGYIAYKIVNDSHQDAMLSGMWDYYNAGSIELIQNTFQCCGYVSYLDRPIADQLCGGFSNSSSTTNTPTSSSQKRSRLIRRQISNNINNNNQVSQSISIPGCQQPWTAFVNSWLTTCYSLSFTFVPFVLVAFAVGLLAANHIYD